MKFCRGEIVRKIDAMVAIFGQQERFLHLFKLLVFQRIQYGTIFYLVLQVKDFWIDLDVLYIERFIPNYVWKCDRTLFVVRTEKQNCRVLLYYCKDFRQTVFL